MRTPGTATSLVSRFAQHAVATPQAVAVEDDGRLVSYEQLDHWSDTVCAVLLSAGVAPGGRVGVLLARDASWIAAILGVLKAGCGYVPLDPLYPPGRLAMMTADSGLTTVLGAPGTPAVPDVAVVAMPAPTATADAGSRPPVGPDSPAPPLGPDSPAPPLGPDSPAYVIYTSGSSGRPKGVPIRHRNVLALLDAAATCMHFTSDDVWSLFHSFSFDFSVWEMWAPLTTGARIVVVPQHVRLDPGSFVAFLARAGVTVVNMVPSVFRHLIASGAGPQDELAVRRIVFGGEAVDPAVVGAWLQTLPPDRRPVVSNMYGITESTVHVTLRDLTDHDLARTEPGTLIGTPLPHVRMRLVDRDLRPVPNGEVGEILLDGPGVSEGYLGRPELNRERFPSLPGADGSSEHCFRTGDLASWDSVAGSYVYRGRADDQVQLHGHRIELGEVEAALRGCPGVSAAAVALYTPPGREPGLLANVVVPGADDPRRAVREIRRALGDVLPRHMAPQHIRVVAALPLTQSGKTDRRALVPPG